MKKERYQKPEVEVVLMPTGQNLLLNLSLETWEVEDFVGIEDFDF